jgi:hypothetical protein
MTNVASFSKWSSPRPWRSLSRLGIGTKYAADERLYEERRAHP